MANGRKAPASLLTRAATDRCARFRERARGAGPGGAPASRAAIRRGGGPRPTCLAGAALRTRRATRPARDRSELTPFVPDRSLHSCYQLWRHLSDPVLLRVFRGILEDLVFRLAADDVLASGRWIDLRALDDLTHGEPFLIQSRHTPPTVSTGTSPAGAACALQVAAWRDWCQVAITHRGG